MLPSAAARHSVDASASGEQWVDPARDARRWSAAPGAPVPRDAPRGQWGSDAPSAWALTLIRRDPASGAQWNVGRIARPGVGAEVMLEMHAPGYAKFAAGDPDGPPFCRRLGLHTKAPPSPARTGLRARAGNASPAAPDELPPLTFVSPWHGTCRFATSGSGRALVCRHACAETTAAAPADVLSELRPHLPGRGLFALAPPADRVRPLSTPLPPSPQRERVSHVFDDSDGDEDLSPDPERLDLSLGRERAGGGRRGRTAKLGKLVLAAGGPGAAMLDLLVAANVAVWWGLAAREASSGG